MSKANQRKFALACSCLPFLLVVAGCGVLRAPSDRDETPQNATPQWRAFNMATGQEMGWSSLVQAVQEADVIVVGEQHDNTTAHELEHRLTASLLAEFPRSAIAMEMFERNEQPFVDLYLDGRIQAETLVKITDSANWGGGKGTWDSWYQPIVDYVKEHRDQGARLKAANCPRSLVKLARLEGFEVLASLEGCLSELVDVPDPDVNDLAYHDRFVAFMTNASSTPPTHQAKKKGPPKKVAPAMGTRELPDPEAFFRAQQTWDASMAHSVLEAKSAHPKVMLFVGEFHMAYEGGLIRRIRHENPDLTLVSISLLRSDDLQLKPNDRGRANYVVYTSD
jgi:uncharacterized iron-regulated protein